jgi:hypothetical protein
VCEAGHSPPYRIGVKRLGDSYPLPHVFMFSYLVKHKDKFNFTLHIS